MATMNAADAWQQSGMRPGRPHPSPRLPLPPLPERAVAGGRAVRPVRGAQPPRPRERVGERGRVDAGVASDDRDLMYRDASGLGAPAPGRPAGGSRSRARTDDRDGYAEPRGGAVRPGARPLPPEQAGRIRGVVAVLAVFLVTLAGAAVDSFIGVGLGLTTLGALVGSSALAALLVRRRDLTSVVVAPPLVFAAVAAANIGLAPSATFTPTTITTLLIQGFPEMTMATGAALLIAVVRWLARR